MYKIQTFEQVVKRHNKPFGSTVPKGFIGCIACGGEGKDYRFEDRDPIEGYKLANKKTCLKCDGRGYLEQELAYPEYLKETARMEAMNIEEAQYNKMVDEINSSLSSKQIAWLKKNYGYGKLKRG